MNADDDWDVDIGEVPTLTEHTDFYRAWEMVNEATAHPATVRARAFAIWVALFGAVDGRGVVTLNATEVAEEFSVSRQSWVHYREVLAEVGLIEERTVTRQTNRRKQVRLTPPMRT